MPASQTRPSRPPTSPDCGFHGLTAAPSGRLRAQAGVGALWSGGVLEDDLGAASAVCIGQQGPSQQRPTPLTGATPHPKAPSWCLDLSRPPPARPCVRILLLLILLLISHLPSRGRRLRCSLYPLCSLNHCFLFDWLVPERRARLLISDQYSASSRLARPLPPRLHRFILASFAVIY